MRVAAAYLQRCGADRLASSLRNALLVVHSRLISVRSERVLVWASLSRTVWVGPLFNWRPFRSTAAGGQHGVILMRTSTAVWEPSNGPHRAKTAASACGPSAAFWPKLGGLQPNSDVSTLRLTGAKWATYRVYSWGDSLAKSCISSAANLYHEIQMKTR